MKDIILFRTIEEFASWLESKQANHSGVWLKLSKKSSSIKSISQQEAIDVALCYGWIDGQMDVFDEYFFLIKFTPRRARSKWSQVNRTRALELMDIGRMKAPGLLEIERAKGDGRWDAAYAPPSKATVPDDLQEALSSNETAAKIFANLDSKNRYAIIHRIGDAKKPQTRAARITKYIDMLSRGDLIYPKLQ